MIITKKQLFFVGVFSAFFNLWFSSHLMAASTHDSQNNPSINKALQGSFFNKLTLVKRYFEGSSEIPESFFCQDLESCLPALQELLDGTHPLLADFPPPFQQDIFIVKVHLVFVFLELFEELYKNHKREIPFCFGYLDKLKKTKKSIKQHLKDNFFKSCQDNLEPLEAAFCQGMALLKLSCFSSHLQTCEDEILLSDNWECLLLWLAELFSSDINYHLGEYRLQKCLGNDPNFALYLESFLQKDYRSEDDEIEHILLPLVVVITRLSTGADYENTEKVFFKIKNRFNNVPENYLLMKRYLLLLACKISDLDQNSIMDLTALFKELRHGPKSFNFWSVLKEGVLIFGDNMEKIDKEFPYYSEASTLEHRDKLLQQEMVPFRKLYGFVSTMREKDPHIYNAVFLMAFGMFAALEENLDESFQAFETLLNQENLDARLVIGVSSLVVEFLKAGEEFSKKQESFAQIFCLPTARALEGLLPKNLSDVSNKEILENMLKILSLSPKDLACEVLIPYYDLVFSKLEDILE